TGLHVPAKKWEECALTRKYMRFVQQKTRVQDQFSEEFFKNHASNSRIDTFTIKMTFMTDELLCDLMKWIGDGEVVIRGLSMEDVRPYFEEELFNRYLKFINPRLLCWRASMEDGAKSPCIIVPQKCQLLDVANAQVDLTNSNQLEYVILRDVHQESQRLFMQGIFDNQFPKLKAALLCVDSIGQRQENLWSNKQWKAIGFKIRTLYSRQPGAHTIHDIRRIDSKWMDKDRATGGYAAESVPEQLSDVKLNDYLGAIKSIEDTALAQVHQVYSEAEAAKVELYGSWASRVKQVWKDKMMKDAEKALQLELIKQEMVDRYKAETEKVYMQAVQAAKEYQQAYLDAKAAQRQAIADKYNEFKQIVNASIEAKVAQAKENMAEIGAYLQQVDELYRNHKAASDAAIEERRQALKDKLATIYNQLETQGNELKADGERLGADLKAFMEKRYQYKQDGHGAAKEVLKEVLTESLEQKLEKKLDKELQKMVEDEIKGKLKHPKMALPVVVKKTTDTETETKVVSPEYKATLLETLTGASAWETVAWVLLALCILLSVALIALIAYQVAQKNKYGKLEGVDSPHRPSMARAERAPINTAPPLTYTHEKPLFGSGLPGPSVTASDPLPVPPPLDDTQQF
ncbi:unnamed protein product, partial [Mesorhabditis spiculigera]